MRPNKRNVYFYKIQVNKVITESFKNNIKAIII